MDFKLLKTFDTVSSMMSFNRAAEILHCTQSTVSAQIRVLEEDLGAPVFERLGRRIALTPEGEALKHHVRRLLSYEQEIRAAVSTAGEISGLISLRAPQSVVELHLPDILKRFCTVYPRVGFDIANCGYYHLTDELRSGEIDAAFLYAMRVESVDLCNTEVLNEALAYVASPTSSLSKRENLTIHDLAGHTLLVPKHDCAYRMQLQQAIAEAHVDTAAIIELNSTKAVVQILKTGFGAALLPERAVAREIADNELVKLRWQDPPSAGLLFIRHRDKPLTGAYGAFVETVEHYFAEQRIKEERA